MRSVSPSRKAPGPANIRPMSADSASFDRAAGPPWTRRASAFARRFADAALNALYPPTCLACRAATGAHGALCPRCWSAMRFIERPFCERLGTPFEHDLGQGLISPQAMADPPAFARARAVARFEDGPARARASAQIFRPCGTLPADRALDGARGRGRARRRRAPDASAAESLAAVAAA